MTDSTTVSIDESGAAPRATVSSAEREAAGREPLAALVAGGAFGAAAFALCALFLGVVSAIAISVAAAIVAAVWRRLSLAMIFAASAVVSALALVAPTIAIPCAALVFGAGLASAARTARRTANNV
ncbi:MAG: hypothetical protein H0U66_11120 [Gemmatimonadaceae bacterium]|nr:hypothetical protein [Gemmatimonadaceae bacterium]